MVHETPSGGETDNEAAVDALTGVLGPLLSALSMLQMLARHMHPPRLESLAEEAKSVAAPLQQGHEGFHAMTWPAHLENFTNRIDDAVQRTTRAIDGLVAAPTMPNAVFEVYRALRHIAPASEALYPLAKALPPVSKFFVADDCRGDAELLDRLASADGGRENVGIKHAGNDAKSRGGFSLYVPETYDPARTYPLVVALHGGSGHGRGFLWSWLADARSREVILLSPTSRDRTWSLMGPDQDSDNIQAMLDFVLKEWSVDTTKLLMTGMSDGGTFSYVSGLKGSSPFTHLAPVSASFHPMMLEVIDAPNVKGRPIYLTHGALDWMFPVDIARTAYQTLQTAGADIRFDEIDDLSHTYPREQNAKILDWLMAN